MVYFAGDTGYNSKDFKEIGEKYKIDLALLAATSDNDIKLVKCLLENGYCYYLIILL